ncbi:type VI secretion system tip protein VgrG [uncultured Draconibacterium sp.]|uniref:type VI secretion system tip protein VgrG n=1 Tax=uncultured Draconibacterium sp. TaxID=1573823 RepID=UPI002AA76980|nr:type VI secretion system tip protein VgrG [uncultured Draconibacterium sp.]
MPENRVIPTARSTDLVSFKILVDGEELSSVYQILSIAVEKEINRIPWAKIILHDGDPASQDFELSNEDMFIPGKEIEIKAGYHSQNETIFKGIVIRHNLKIRLSGAVLIVECKDLAVKLTVGRKSKYFYESKDSEILEQVIASYSLENEIEETNVEYPEMVQYNVSDWDFCVTRAQANGKVCVVDDGKISVVSPDYSQSEKLTLVYGATIFDFDAEIDAQNQFENVTSYAWNAADQDLLEIEADTPHINSNGNISPEDLASVIGADKLELRDGSSMSDAGLQDWANAKSLFNQLSKIRGKVKFQGVHDVKPNTTIELAGVGNRFNGKVYVSAVRHQIADGDWTCDAQFGINPKWFSETIDINPLPASGLLAAVNGLQIAKVTQLQDDPKGEDRILVRMPLVNNQEQGVWARIATLDAGKERGSFFRPEIDDEVIVGFLNGNPNDPIILGMLNSSAKPAPIRASDDNHEKGFVTRSGMKFIFDDDKKSVTLETPGGKIIKVDEDEGIIQLEDENSNILKLDDNGITIESEGDINLSATGDVKIDGTNVEISANANFTAAGNAGAEVSSPGVTEIKGSIVNIN